MWGKEERNASGSAYEDNASRGEPKAPPQYDQYDKDDKDKDGRKQSLQLLPTFPYLINKLKNTPVVLRT